MHEERNADQKKFWDGPTGQKWVEHQTDMDRNLADANAGVLRIAAAKPGERVPDPGRWLTELGEMVPKSGEMLPRLGGIAPEPGDLVPEPREQLPELGEKLLMLAAERLVAAHEVQHRGGGNGGPRGPAPGLAVEGPLAFQEK